MSACPSFSTPWGRKSVGSASASVGASTAELATWRCIELATSRPARVRLRWHAVGPVSDPEITFDVGRAVRVYIMTDWFEVFASSLVTGVDADVQFMVADAAGPSPCVLQRSVSLAVDTYDSATDEAVRPPWFAARLYADAATGGTAAVTFWADGVAVSDVTTAAWPAGGVPLAGITQITATVSGAPARFVWLLEL